MSRLETAFTTDAGIEIPLICGAMYPCSNPELVAAASNAGGMGIIQPISMTFVYNHDLRKGIRLIQSLTDKPVGFNALVEKSSRMYQERMQKWVDIALEEGIRFFITALGNPLETVKKVHAAGGKVYHDVTNMKFAQKAVDCCVDGLICINDNAGGHTGEKDSVSLFHELSGLGLPLVCAGGIGSEQAFVDALDLGYAGVQMGTRFIATTECLAHTDYKNAIVDAGIEDIILTEKISGIPVSVIRTPHIEKMGTRAGWLAKKMLQHPKGKQYMRMIYTLKSVWQLKHSSLKGIRYKDIFMAGKSVDTIDGIESVKDIIDRCALLAQSS
jgi:nitronate monooxygenase